MNQLGTAKVQWKTVFETVLGGDWSHSGIDILSDGRLVFAELGGRGLVYLDEQSGQTQKVATAIQDAHGIVVHGENIWIADPGPGDTDGQVIRVNLGGQILENVPAPTAAEFPGQFWRPTSVAHVSVPGKYLDEVWIADGYGRNLIHRRLVSGEIISFDGAGSGVAFDCPHGIAVDTRAEVPQIVVADRNNTRLVFFDMEGSYLKSVSDTIMTSPSSIAVWGEQLVVTDLFGAILSVDKEGKVRPVVATANNNERPGWPNRVLGSETVSPEITEGIPNSPHGITVAPNGKVYFTEWFLGGRVVSLARKA